MKVSSLGNSSNCHSLLRENLQLGPSFRSSSKGETRDSSGPRESLTVTPSHLLARHQSQKGGKLRKEKKREDPSSNECFPLEWVMPSKSHWEIQGGQTSLIPLFYPNFLSGSVEKTHDDKSLPSVCLLFHSFNVKPRHSPERWLPVLPRVRTDRLLQGWSNRLDPAHSHMPCQTQTSSSKVANIQMHQVFNHFPNKGQFQDPNSSAAFTQQMKMLIA